MRRRARRLPSRRSAINLMRFAVSFAAALACGVQAQPSTSGSCRFAENWLQLPEAVTVGWVSSVAVNVDGTIYAFRRCPVACSNGSDVGASDPPASVLVIAASGAYLREWVPTSGGRAKKAHTLKIDRDGFVWTTDTRLHVVRKYRADGELLLTLGRVGVAGDGADTFNEPTDVLVASDGSIFVTDGYGNQRVVQFGPEGQFVREWGGKGAGPGQFRLPHALAEDGSGRILVADRCGLAETGCTDGRVQLFDREGRYLREWRPPGDGFAPQSIAVDRSDRLYISDTHERKVWIVAADSLEVLDSIDGAVGHGLAITPTGDAVYLSGPNGLRRYARQ